MASEWSDMKYVFPGNGFGGWVKGAMLGVSLWAVPGLVAETLGPGATFVELTVGKKVYRNVQVKSVSARTISVFHDGGMA